MRTKLNKLWLILFFSAFLVGNWAVVSDYTFTGSAGTYTEISGGTVLLTGVPAVSNPSFNAIPLGFSFEYDGTAYTTVSIAENGFLAMGDEVVTSNLAISATTATNNAIAALNRNLIPRDDGEIMHLLSGTAPNRVFIVQWKNFRRDTSLASNDILNFQIHLHEEDNKIVFSYGGTTAMTVNTAATVQVGLRGANNQDYNNRTTSTDWTDTEAGTSNTSNCRLSAEVFPSEGLSFSFSPAQQGAPPMAAQTPNPDHLATNVSVLTDLSWQAGGGLVDGYKVYLGTNTPPTNMVNGVTQTNTIHDIVAALNYSTQYFWQIVPFNADGDAVDCPIWSFTTLADPTVTTYPYVQNFDTATPPALPLGWVSLNLNNDAYSWASFNDPSANTAPNAMRIRYNDTVAMDDWLVAAPMVFDAEYIYKVKFYYRAHVATQAEKLALYMGSSPTAAAMTTELWVNENITNVNYQMVEVDIPANTAGTYYLGFHGYSPANRFYIYVDSFSVTETQPVANLYPPSNFHASVAGNDVHLAWDAPEPPPTGEWITWCNIDQLGNAIGTGGATTFDVAHLYDSADLATFHGSTLTHVQMVAGEANCVYTLKIWTGGTATAPGSMVHSQVIAAPALNVWTEVELTTPVPIPATGNLWIGYGVDTQTGHPAGCDDGPMVPGKGNIMNFNGWTTLDLLGDGLTYNWLIQGYVDHNRALVPMPEPIYEAPHAFQSGQLAMGTSSNVSLTSAKNLTREQTGYKLYRDGSLVATINDPATLTYIDADLAVGSYSYTLTAYYDDGESDPAGPLEVVVEDLDAPTDLAATVEGNDVNLAWTSPQPPQPGEWISWSDNSAIGNSIGTDSASTFEVAHRYEASDLTEHVGGALTQVKFAPMYANCVYTVKIWTGGTSAIPGTLVHEQVVSNPTVNDWTTAILTTPITIAADTQYWIGYRVNTQGGHPAGCDNGPMVAGKGNMMYFNSAWTTLDALNAAFNYNWLIQGFVTQGRSVKAIQLPALVEAPLPAITGQFSSNYTAQARDLTRAVLLGYKVYRDDVAIATIDDPETVTYTDNDLPNGDYIYGVSGVYNTGESAIVTINVNVDLQMAPVLMEDSFEDYPDFATTFGSWTLLDQDNSETYGIDGVDFPGSGSQMAFIIFNPSQTVPPLAGLEPYEGNKMAASFAAVTPPNKDWLITQRIELGTNSSLKFYARSHTALHGLERFRVGVSTRETITPQGFQYLTGPDYVEAPANWTEYIYDLSAYDEQKVYITIRSVSNDAFIFYVDDFSVHSIGGSNSDDDTAPVLTTELKGNYPNPFNPETTIRFSTKEAGPVALEIYNVKGQLVKKLVNEDKAAGNHTVVWNGTDQNNRTVSTGVYFYKMHAGKYSSTRKMIMMK